MIVNMCYFTEVVVVYAMHTALLFSSCFFSAIYIDWYPRYNRKQLKLLCYKQAFVHLAHIQYYRRVHIRACEEIIDNK